MSEYTGKIVLVVGGAQGIGFSIASAFAKEGAYVLIADKDVDAADKACSSLTRKGFKVESLYIDLSIPSQMISLVEVASNRAGKIDILINNVKAGERLSLLDESESNWDLTNNVILKSAFFSSQEFVKLIKVHGGKGSILNIVSVAADLVTNESPSYHVAKAGLQQLTRYIAIHAGQYNIRVNSILPGLIVQSRHRERFNEESNREYRTLTSIYQPMKEVGDENDIAEAALFLCSEKAKYISGASLIIDGGATVQEQFGLLLRFNSR